MQAQNRNTLNPWENITLFDYEAHMSLSSIQQLQALNAIMRSQITRYPIKSLAILGVAGGNGLEHIDTNQIEAVYGIDVNQHYLDECKKRYKHLEKMLILKKSDFTEIDFQLPSVDLIVANLFIEYVGIDVFAKKLMKQMPKYLSCVIQSNPSETFVSDSPYVNKFEELEKLHVDVNKDMLIEKMKEIHIELISCSDTTLPNGKVFIELNFKSTLTKSI